MVKNTKRRKNKKETLEDVSFDLEKFKESLKIASIYDPRKNRAKK
jgi:hypothetical protein